jgi:hypothetical protein
MSATRVIAIKLLNLWAQASAHAKGAGMSQRHITSPIILSRFAYCLICDLLIIE